MAGSSPAMTKTPVFASTPASPPRSFLWSGFRASFLFLFGGFTNRGGIGLGEHAGDCTAQHPDANPVGDVDRDLLRIVDPRHRSDDPAPGHNPVAAPQRVEHRLLILGLSLLWADQQKIEYDEDQD